MGRTLRPQRDVVKATYGTNVAHPPGFGYEAEPAPIRDYFNFLPTAPPECKGVLGEHRVRFYGDMAVNRDTYIFSTVRDGQPATIPARFSFGYRNRNGRWMIVDHHSSAVPAPPR